jgi:hypothetical protein
MAVLALCGDTRAKRRLFWLTAVSILAIIALLLAGPPSPSQELSTANDSPSTCVGCPEVGKKEEEEMAKPKGEEVEVSKLQPAAEQKVGDERSKPPSPWPRVENLAKACVDLHAIDRNSWHSLNQTTLHIVYFAWLPDNGNAQRIIPAQMAEVQASGLLDRPNTKLYFIVVSISQLQRTWFDNLDVVKRYKPFVLHSERNTFEFPGIRFLYELGCQNQNDLFLYFHSKGARYNKGRIGMEMVLTKELLVSWRDLLSLLVANPLSLTYGLGGPAYQWQNFFYMRGALFPIVPKPHVDGNRYWYEEWAGYDLLDGDPSKSISEVSQCGSITGMDVALKEHESKPPNLPRRAPQYSILRCGPISINSPQLDAWAIPARRSKVVGE